MNLYLDIETIPDQRDGAVDEFFVEELESFKTPSSITIGQMASDLNKEIDPTDKKSKTEWLEIWEREYKSHFCAKKAVERWRKTALDGSRGQICVIGYAIADGPATTIVADSEDKLLAKLFLGLSTSTTLYKKDITKIVGHNVLDFDLRFLYQRAVINGIEPSFELNHSPYSDRVFDTMSRWAGYKKYISMDALCNAIGVPTPKTELDGSMVWDYWRDGRKDEVIEYCKADVEAVRACYKKMNFCI